MNANEVADLIHRSQRAWPGVDTEGWESVLAPAEYRDAREALTVRRSDMRPPDLVELAQLIPVRDTMLTADEVENGLRALAGLREAWKQGRNPK